MLVLVLALLVLCVSVDVGVCTFPNLCCCRYSIPCFLMSSSMMTLQVQVLHFSSPVPHLFFLFSSLWSTFLDVFLLFFLFLLLLLLCILLSPPVLPPCISSPPCPSPSSLTFCFLFCLKNSLLSPLLLVVHDLLYCSSSSFPLLLFSFCLLWHFISFLFLLCCFLLFVPLLSVQCKYLLLYLPLFISPWTSFRCISLFPFFYLHLLDWLLRLESFTLSCSFAVVQLFSFLPLSLSVSFSVVLWCRKTLSVSSWFPAFTLCCNV